MQNKHFVYKYFTRSLVIDKIAINKLISKEFQMVAQIKRGVETVSVTVAISHLPHSLAKILKRIMKTLLIEYLEKDTILSAHHL